jgi:hypothetical protein
MGFWYAECMLGMLSLLLVLPQSVASGMAQHLLKLRRSNLATTTTSMRKLCQPDGLPLVLFSHGLLVLCDLMLDTAGSVCQSSCDGRQMRCIQTA